MIITREVLDRINRKNRRARARMARRYTRKVDARNRRLTCGPDQQTSYGRISAAQCVQYTALEMELNGIGDGRVIDADFRRFCERVGHK